MWKYLLPESSFDKLIKIINLGWTYRKETKVVFKKYIKISILKHPWMVSELWFQTECQIYICVTKKLSTGDSGLTFLLIITTY